MAPVIRGTLVLTGDDDPLLPVRTARLLARAHPARAAAFAPNTLWITPFDPAERIVAGEYNHQTGAAAGRAARLDRSQPRDRRR